MRLSNCVVMENVVIEDSIICDNCIISGKSSVKLTILGRGQKTAEGAEMISQLVLDSDRMMEVWSSNVSVLLADRIKLQQIYLICIFIKLG